jgi:Clathrin adaptor complex small chain
MVRQRRGNFSFLFFRVGFPRRRRPRFSTAPLRSSYAQIKFLLLVSRQGKVRLSKFYETLSSKDKAKITREVTTLVLNRGAKMCNIVEYKEQKIVYKRYASLYFVTCVEKDDNELMVLETIHHFVEILDRCAAGSVICWSVHRRLPFSFRIWFLPFLQLLRQRV